MTDGISDGDLIAIVLDAVPGVPKDDWMDEPEGLFGMAHSYGVLIFSTMIPADSPTIVLDEHSDDEPN